MLHPRTERIQLRQWRPEDKQPFAEMNADARVMEFFLAILTREESDAIADRCHALIEERGWGLWVAELTGTGEFVGFVGLHVPSAQLPFSPCVEIGWRLARRCWGYGLATEAAEAVLRVGFDELALPEIVSYASVTNARSLAVMRRIGMTSEVATFEHPAVPVGSSLREHCLYRLTGNDWSKSVPKART